MVMISVDGVKQDEDLHVHEPESTIKACLTKQDV